MKKRWILIFALMACLCLLASCQSGESERFTVKTAGQNNQNSQNPAGSTVSEQQQNSSDAYDPLAEEDSYLGDTDYWGSLADSITAVPTSTPAPTVRSEYAGATPVLIDPIDKPTATPVPPITFAYQVYDATKLGISFEGPVGWTTDASQEGSFSIQNPNAAIDYPATLTITAQKVNSNYSKTQLETVVKDMLSAIGTAGFDDYDRSSTASRSLLGQTGIYANYSGTLTTGQHIAGRVQAACVDKVLYTIHITYPYAYRDTYIDQVFHHLRDTIKVTH